MTNDDVRDVVIAIRDERTSLGSEFGQAVLDLIDCKEHYRDLDGWKSTFGLADIRACLTCGCKMNDVQITALSLRPKPLNIKTIYTSHGRCHGGMAISTVVTENGKTLEHTRRERVISYDSYQGLVRLGKLP